MLIPKNKLHDPGSSISRMRVYGLTGAMGSGKTEAARYFIEQGVPVIHADLIGHELIAPGGKAVEAVSAAFGERILSNGAIDRTKLGALVFSDESARLRLNAIVHPLISDEIAQRCAKLERQGHAFALIDAALIAEDGKKTAFLDGLIVVDCPIETRLQRLAEGRGISRQDALQRMKSQAPPERKLAIADWVLDNSGTLERLRMQVNRLIEEVKQHACQT